MNKLFSILLVVTIAFVCSCTSTRQSKTFVEINHLQFLDEYDIPFNKVFDNTVTGGLSGIDYDASNDHYYLISDDRSAKNPARFYTAKIAINNSKIDSVYFLKNTFLKNKMGNYYPGFKENAAETPDPEALRFHPTDNTFMWSSEGERIVSAKDTILQNPSITIINSEGNYIDTFRLPERLLMKPTENGPRQNGVLEGLTFSKNNKNLFVSLEEPLYEDGPRAGTKDSSAMVRFIKFDIQTRKPVAEYGYKIDPVAHPPFPLNAFKVNGISDILCVGESQFLVVERSYSTGRLSCTIKIFLADISSAENIQNISSLKDTKNIKLVSKKLLLNMDDLKFYIDNIEGVTFGPTLPNGNKTLIFVSDNNFNPLEKTQFLLFEIR
jgi:hypothetical protein